MLSTSEEEGTEPTQPGPSSPQRQPKVKKESKKSKKPTKKKKVSNDVFISEVHSKQHKGQVHDKGNEPIATSSQTYSER